MLQRMVGVDSWLDIASLGNVEEDHSFLFLKKNSMKIFFFFFNLEILNFFKELKILIGDFFFFLKQPKKYEPIAPSPKAFFENFLFFFFSFFFLFWKFWKSWIFSWNWNFWLMIFFFFEKLNFFKELKISNFFWKKPKKYEPNAPSPKAFFENFPFFFLFWKFYKSWIFSWNWNFLLMIFFWKI